MAHNITIRRNGVAEVFTGNREPAWHHLGITVEGQLTSSEALKAAHLDWKVRLSPVSTEGREIAGSFATVREDDGNPLGIVGSRYTIIQNTEAFEFFDAVVESKEAIYDTAGSLGGGSRVWIMAKLPGKLFLRNRPGDAMEKNVLLVNCHDGSGAMTMQIVGNRVVCQNTLSVALNGATNRASIRHTEKYKDRMEEAQKALGLCVAYFDDLQGVMDALDEMKMSQGEMKEFTETLIPSYAEKDSARLIGIREEIVDLFSNGRGNLGRSRWDALNAVTEYADWNRSMKKNGNLRGLQEARFASQMFGSSAQLKARAASLLMPS